MFLINKLYETVVGAKNIVVKTYQEIVKPPKDDLKKAIGFIPGGETIVNWVGNAVDKTLSTAQEYLINKPLSLISEYRDKIKGILKDKFDEKSLQRGARLDRRVARRLSKLSEDYGAGPVEKTEKRLFADWRAQKTAAIEEMLPHLDRFPPDAQSDGEVIKREKHDDESFSAKIDAEKALEVPESTESDVQFISHLAELMSSYRRRSGMSETDATLKLDKDLSEKAMRRANFVKNNETEPMVPLSYLLHPPLKRLEIQKNVPFTMVRGNPRFDTLTKDERKRIKPDSIKENDDKKTYSMTFFEKDEDYARRVRDNQRKRRPFTDQYDDISVILDFNEGTYPTDGDPSVVLDKLMENPEYKAALMSRKEKVGIGMTRAGSKVYVTIFMSNDKPKGDEPILVEPASPEADINRWWFERIPETERREGTLFHKYFHAPAGTKNAFKSGYSLYQFYLFKKKIDALATDREISIVNIEPYLESILYKEYKVLIVTLNINGERHMIKLLEGTDMVDVPEKGSSKKSPEAERSVGNFITLNEYYDHVIKKQNVPARKHTPDSFSPVPPQGHVHPEIDAPPPREAREEEEEEEFDPSQPQY